MKKTYYFLILCLIALFPNISHGQTTLTLTNTQQTCNNNGIVTATWPANFVTPVTVTWAYANTNTIITHTVTSGNTDVLTGYTGQQMYVNVVSATQQTTSNGFSAPAFIVGSMTTGNVCPALPVTTGSAIGGVAPYSYNWISMPSNTPVSTSNPASLPLGSYRLVVTDANGCVAYKDSLYVNQAPGFSMNMMMTPASCTNGTATATNFSGGVAPYTAVWSNNASGTTITGLTKGTYSVIVTDAQNCSVSGSVFVTQTPTITVNTSVTPATCLQNNGGITATATGGQNPYTYQWSNSQSTQAVGGLSPGSYSVVATDANGCTGSASAAINIVSPITVSYSSTASICTSNTGSATLNITGGTSPYTVTWNTFPIQTGITATNLSMGNHSFHIVDAVGCIRNGTVVIQNTNPLSAITSVNPALCASATGSAGVTVSGGTPPYTYSWNNSATTASITNVTAGSYIVTIHDNGGCTLVKSIGVTSLSPLNVNFSITPASCIYTNDASVTAVVTGGTAPFTYSWGPGATLSNIASGYKSVTVTDANGCSKYATTFVGYNASNNTCYCTITGTAYHDVNNNCIKDAGEPGIPNLQIHLNPFGYTYTNSSGVYTFKAPAGSYTLSQYIGTFYPLAACQANNIPVTATTSPSGCTQTYNFAHAVNPIHDMRVNTWTYIPPIPGFSYSNITTIYNMGTVQESTLIEGHKTDPQLSMTLSPSAVFTNSAPAYYNITSGALSLAPAATYTITSSTTIPTNMPLTTVLSFKDSVVHAGPMSNWINDFTPINNICSSSPVVVGAYDPNFKEVSPKGTGPNGDITASDSELTYMVHFQNLGTYQAQNIIVLDTLDSDLDWNTLKPIYSSHPSRVDISNGGVLKYSFNNINLPAKVQNEPASHGLFVYSIRTKKYLPAGTQFKNSAAIYFDFNAPVITNTTVNTLTQSTTQVLSSGKADAGFTVYPNPAGKTCYVQTDASGFGKQVRIRVTDLSGKLLIEQPVSETTGTQLIQLNTGALTPGMYFINISGDRNKATQKLMIL